MKIKILEKFYDIANFSYIGYNSKEKCLEFMHNKNGSLITEKIRLPKNISINELLLNIKQQFKKNDGNKN